MDFRAEVAAATARRLNATGQTLAESQESGCLPVRGGGSLRYAVALLRQVILAGSVLLVLACLVLVRRGVLWPPLALAVQGTVMLVVLLEPLARGWVLRFILPWRTGALAPRGLPRRSVSLEDASTFKKFKLVPEDFALCTLDAERRQLLLEGCAYRYRLCARDVVSTEVVRHFDAGVRLSCHLSGQPFDIVLVEPGFGAFRALAPKRLAREITRTLFGVDAHSYVQPAPPVTVCAECGRVLLANEAIGYRERLICAACKPLFLQRLREGAVNPGPTD